MGARIRAARGTTSPWHRVLGSSGKISLPVAAGGARQRRLLEAEGVQFRDSGAVMAELFAKDTGTCRGTGGSMVRRLRA